MRKLYKDLIKLFIILVVVIVFYCLDVYAEEQCIKILNENGSYKTDVSCTFN